MKMYMFCCVLRMDQIVRWKLAYIGITSLKQEILLFIPRIGNHCQTRRLQLVLQPSLYERVKARAKVRGLSVNEYVHRILDNAV